MRVSELDLTDPSARRAWHAVTEAVLAHDRPHGWGVGLQAFEAWVAKEQSVYYATRRFGALGEDGVLLGVAELGTPLEDNTHLADVEIAVHPGARGQGVGAALLDRVRRACVGDGRTTLTGELYLPDGLVPEDSPGYRFARSHGFAPVHEEDHLLLDLPVPQQVRRRLESTGAETAYDVVTWGDSCPEEYVAAYCAMRTQMQADVPSGEMDRVPVVFDERRLRAGEDGLRGAWLRVVAAARRRTDGVMGGYSMLLLPVGDDRVMQDDTLVMPEHRGQGLGTRLKLATLDVLNREHPERRVVHTWTAPENDAMQRVNAAFGYRRRERMYEMELSAGRCPGGSPDRAS